MKTSAIKKLRQKLDAGQTTYGLWVTLESASVTEMAVAIGLDWIVIDAEHGHLDWSDIMAHTRAAVRSDTVVLVRVAELGLGLIKRVLDIGADGVVVPWVETPQQLEQAIAFSRYPPAGVRGIGGERATCWGGCFVESVGEADENVIVAPIIETVTGGKNIEAICRVPGADLFFVGPADYSSSAGYAGQWEGPGVGEELVKIKDAIARAGKFCGLVTTGEDDLARRREQGFSLLAIGVDGGLLLRTMMQSLADAGHARKISPGFVPENQPQSTPAVPAKERPSQFTPDRNEVINRVQDAARVDIAGGVIFRPLVGRHNQARDFTTGIVTFLPGAELPYHRHTFVETVTLLQGRAAMEIEGRRYTLSPLDNVVVPPGLAHYVFNLSTQEPAVFHIAMASEEPSRELVTQYFSTRVMPNQTTGQAGAERVTKQEYSQPYEANPGARFVDFFNRDLGCNEMSGGYGLFAPGAQLPCHIHDFDESITIVQGEATCIVEGKKYSLSNNDTALVPRGRCHYFINDTGAPMAMVWVYAGPTPERMVMESALCDLPWSTPGVR